MSIDTIIKKLKRPSSHDIEKVYEWTHDSIPQYVHFYKWVYRKHKEEKATQKLIPRPWWKKEPQAELVTQENR